MNTEIKQSKVSRLLSILEFFSGLFFGVAIFGAYLAFQMFPSFLLSLIASISVFCIFSFLMVTVRYFILRVHLTIKQCELLEDMRDKMKEERKD